MILLALVIQFVILVAASLAFLTKLWKKLVNVEQMTSLLKPFRRLDLALTLRSVELM